MLPVRFTFDASGEVLRSLEDDPKSTLINSRTETQWCKLGNATNVMSDMLVPAVSSHIDNRHRHAVCSGGGIALRAFDESDLHPLVARDVLNRYCGYTQMDLPKGFGSLPLVERVEWIEDVSEQGLASHPELRGITEAGVKYYEKFHPETEADDYFVYGLGYSAYLLDRCDVSVTGLMSPDQIDTQIGGLPDDWVEQLLRGC